MEKLIPTISIILNIGSAIGYACKGDWPRCGYWIAAGWLTYSIVYLIGAK